MISEQKTANFMKRTATLILITAWLGVTDACVQSAEKIRPNILTAAIKAGVSEKGIT